MSHIRARLILGLLAASTVVLALLVPAETGSRPFNWGTSASGDTITSVRWPDSVTIHVYLPEHPDSANANDCIREGIERWTALLATRGITLEFHMGENPPKGATNAVGLDWVPDGSLSGGDEGHGEGTASGSGTNYELVGGDIDIEVDNTDCEFLANLGMHEFGHVLGFDDDPSSATAHNAMDHHVENADTMGFSARDSAEWVSLYGAFDTGQHAQGEVQGNGNRTGPGFNYFYTVFWGGGPEIPIFVVKINADPGTVIPMLMPPGWELDYPPIYLDGTPSIPSTPTTRKLHFRSNEFGLSAMNPVGTFSIMSPWPPGLGWGHIMVDNDGDRKFDVFPLPVPTDPTVSAPEPYELPSGLRVSPPSPNPFSKATAIRFTVPSAFTQGVIDIFDAAGRLVRSLPLGEGERGIHAALWDGRGAGGDPVSAGVYFYRITLDAEHAFGRVVRVE